MAIEVDDVTVEETGNDVVDEFLNAGMPEGIEDDDPSPEPTAETTEPEPTDGPARDEQGRFAKKEESVEGAPAAPAQTPTPAVDAAPTPDTPVVEPQPFTVKVSGKEYSVEGAQYVPGEGLYIPDNQFQNIRNLISEGAYYKQNWKQLEGTAEKRGYDRALASSPEVQQAKVTMGLLNEVLSDPEKLVEFVTNLETQGPMLRERARAEMAERQLAEFRQGNERQQQETQSQELEQQKQAALSETIGELRAHPELKVLTPEDWTLIDKQLATLNTRGGLFVTKDDGTYLDTNAIEEIAAHVLSVRKQMAEVAKKAEEAAKFNAAQRPAAPRSAAVAPRTGSAPRATPTPKEPTAKDIRKDFMAGKLDMEIDE